MSEKQKTGPLKYTIAEVETGNWSIARNSKGDDNSVQDTYEENYTSEDAALEKLYYAHERMLRQEANTQAKLDYEKRELQALKQAIGNWTPTPEVAPI